MDLFNLISAPNPTKVKTGTQPRTAHEVPLLTVTANRMIDMENTTVASGSSETPSAIEKSSLDFANEDPTPLITERYGEEEQTRDGLSHGIPPVQNPTTTEAVLEPDPEKEVAVIGPQSTLGGKSLAAMRLDVGSTLITPATQKTPSDAKTMSDPDPLPSSRKTAPEIPTENVATAEVQDMFSMESPGSGKSTSVPSMVGSPRGIYQPGWGVTNNCRLDTPNVCQDVYNMNLAQQVAMGSQLRLRFEQEARNLETLLEAEVDMKKAAEAKNVGLAKELESLRAQFADLQVSNNQLSEQVSTLQTQVTGEERIKAAFEEFKKYEDNRVSSRCAEMDARLDALSIDFDEELYPHMLTAIAGRRWVIGHGLRLAVMKCAESTKLRQVFANVVSAGIAKGMSEGLKHGIEHGKANLDLAAIEAYDPEADTKYVAALHALKDLKYPLVDQLEKLKDLPIDLIMTSLYLESDSGENTPQWIRELRPSSSQLKIPVYLEVRDPKDPWSFKEEILLEDAIAANISRAEKKKKCRVVCRTYGVGSAHHARSDGVPVSVPTIAPHGFAILLTDAATQTQISEDEASPRLLRSNSLPPMYNLDWP
ncbi:hypothetical protein Tco_0707295 [Tanacetum coccineum]|uniref:Transposase (Putative), gypsy type n=1 Tax=Tanacetum coccineum TaxID=301880 RepID=A0ABQ4Y9V1_9ASTR